MAPGDRFTTVGAGTAGAGLDGAAGDAVARDAGVAEGEKDGASSVAGVAHTGTLGWAAGAQPASRIDIAIVRLMTDDSRCIDLPPVDTGTRQTASRPSLSS